MEKSSRKIAELALYTSDKTIDYARISQPEKIENLEVSTLYNLIIKNKKERRGVIQKTLKSGLTKDLERIKFLKVLLLDGCKGAQDASLTIEKETAILLQDDRGSKEKHVVNDKVTIEKELIFSDKRVKTNNSSTQTADSNESIKIKMVDKYVQTLDLINYETINPPVKRKMVETRNEYSSVPGQISIFKKVAFMNNPADENINSSASNIAKSSFMSARDVLIEQDTLKSQGGRLGAQPSGLKRLGNNTNRSILSIKKNPVESEKSISNEQIDDRLKNIDPKMIESIRNEIQCNVSRVAWDDIAGLDHAKKSIMEVVCWPMLRPDLFSGIRAPPKGLLLFGPPGTGKTLIGKCVASSVKATFFSISSSTLTSKWIGDGEKMVRALFAVARVHQPSVVFVDEIDSLLTQRSEGENEATRRIKTEFLIQFDGCGTQTEDRILVIGATNRPGEIDEAARRRFRKKLYIPLPDSSARRTIVENLLKPQKYELNSSQIDDIISMTEGYSGSDMDGLIREASLEPLRDVNDIANIREEDVRPINHSDFVRAVRQVRASVTEKDLSFYLKFDEEFGSGSS